MQAVLEDLANPNAVFDAVPGPLRNADEVVLAGGPGAVLLSDAVAE